MKDSLTVDDRELLHSVRAAAAFALSVAVQQVFPQTVVLRTRVTEIGFACDVVTSQPLELEVLSLVDRQMHTLMLQDLELRSGEMMAANVAEFYRHHGYEERAACLPDDTGLVETLRSGAYLEILSQPHPEALSIAKAFKLLGIEHYEELLDDGTVVQVTTLYGTAFCDRQQLKQYLKRVAEATERDHRLLGRQLALYAPCPAAGIGEYLWQPKGVRMRQALLDKWRNLLTEERFQFICTPPLVEGELPSSRLPLHAELFALQQPAFYDLPLRFAECANVEQPVAAHELCGLLRQPHFTADEESVFCRPDQVVKLLISSLQTINKTITILGLQCRSTLCLRGEGSRGTPAQWKRALTWIEEALTQVAFEGLTREKQPSLSGPRLELRVVDLLGREWLVAWVGIDCVLPEQLKLGYQNKEGDALPPVMIARSLLTSLERTLALLVEQCAGAFPLWLAPEQVRVLPVDDAQRDYAEQIVAQCHLAGLRVDVDSRPQTLAARVFAAEAAKVPFIVIVGEKEQKERVVTMRTGQHRQRGDRMTLQEMASAIHKKTLEE
jgi:threonyl-tRNA synthetase